MLVPFDWHIDFLHEGRDKSGSRESSALTSEGRSDEQRKRVCVPAQRCKAAKAQRKDIVSSLLVFRQSIDDSDSVTNELGVEVDHQPKSHIAQAEM